MTYRVPLPDTAVKHPGEGNFTVDGVDFDYWRLRKRRYASITRDMRGIVQRYPDGDEPSYTAHYDGVQVVGPVGGRFLSLKAARQALADHVNGKDLV